MKTKIIIFFLGFFLSIAIILFFSHEKESQKPAQPINDISKNTGKPSKTEINSEEKIIETLKTEHLPIETKPSETPITDGIKARTANITLTDEMYTAELVKEREQVANADPISVRPKQPFIKWVMQFSGSVAGSIAVKDNKLFFGTYDYQAFILNAETGEVLSQNKTISQPINTTHIYKDLFLVPQRNGQVTAFSTSDGKEKWNHRSAVDKGNTELDLSISGIAVFGNRFYVSKHWGNLYIGNADTGILEQDVGVTYESRINLPAIKTEDGIIYSNIAGEIHCFKDDGTENWHYTIPKGYPIATYLNKDTFYILNTEKELIALNLKDRTIIWSTELAGFGYDSIVINNNKLYVSAKDLYSINTETGKVIWQIKAKSEDGFCRGIPLIVDDNIIAIEQGGRLLRVSQKDAVVLKEFDFKETIRSPIALNIDMILMATINKKIYLIEIKEFK